MVLIAHISPPEAGLVFSNNHVQLQIADKLVGKGSVYVTHDNLCWQPNNMNDGIMIPWRQISVHGISTQPNKRVYFMLDHHLTWPVRDIVGHVNGQNGFAENDIAPNIAANHDAVIERDEGNETDESDDSVDAGIIADEEPATECWLMPDDENIIDTMYQSMNLCQAMHNDNSDASDDSFMDADDGEEHIDDEALRLGGEGADAAEGYMQNLNINDERFEDADE